MEHNLQILQSQFYLTEGAMLKNHLVGGVRKGALTEEQAEAKFQAWVDDKDMPK